LLNDIYTRSSSGNKKKIKLDIISGRSETARGGYMGLVTAVGCDINTTIYM